MYPIAVVLAAFASAPRALISAPFLIFKLAKSFFISIALNPALANALFSVTSFSELIFSSSFAFFSFLLSSMSSESF
nr:MAG TPA: hypothetical protein [Caudoviricetes sp.]